MWISPREGVDVPTGPPVLSLAGRDATQTTLTGPKAANLAVAGQHRLPVVDGFVVPVRAARRVRDEAAHDVLRSAWLELTDHDIVPLVVRSSSPEEDTTHSSHAGEFTSVVDVHGWEDFVRAFDEVVASGAGAPMAVLVQRHLDPRCGGVLFGADPVTGRTDRCVVAVVEGGPWDLVAGAVEGRRYDLDPRGRVLADHGDGPRLGRRLRRELVQLAGRARAIFDGPQDIEWAVDADGRLRLLQSRPITVVGVEPAGPRFGPGPVAETFPAPVPSLAADLWLPPLRTAIRETLLLTGAVSRRAAGRSPIVIEIGGRVAVDLDLVEGKPGSRLRAIDPRPALRQLAASWRTGRLRTTFPRLAAELLSRVDDALLAVPPLEEIDDEGLLRILRSSSAHLVGVHGHELLAARFQSDAPGTTGVAHALAAVRDGRRSGHSDLDIIARTPVALAIVPPNIDDREPELPDPGPGASRPVEPLSPREELRLRVRWLQEIGARVAVELGRRLTERALLAEPAAVASLSLRQLEAMVRGDLHAAPRPSPAVAAAPPLPAVFRMAGDVVVAEAAGTNGGVGAGGGRGQGPVVHERPEPGDVLVVTTLDPALAPMLPRLAALVAETGSPLSHLAILAREHGVPTVVGYDGAKRLFPTGVVVVVDGRTGDVERAVAEVTTP